MTATNDLIAGAAAGAGSQFATAPLDLLRVWRQLKVDSYPCKSLPELFRSIARSKGGYLALFCGTVTSSKGSPLVVLSQHYFGATPSLLPLYPHFTLWNGANKA